MSDMAAPTKNDEPQMEGNSDAAAKNRRGRPRRFPEAVALYQSLGPRKSNRAAVDAIFAGRAIRLLGGDQNSARLSGPLAWLNDKRSLQTQLGRIAFEHGDDLAQRLAGMLCHWRPSTKGGVAYLRRLVRNDEERQANPTVLVARLVSTINVFRDEYPIISKTDLLAALNEVSCIVRKAEIGGSGKGSSAAGCARVFPASPKTNSMERYDGDDE